MKRSATLVAIGIVASLMVALGCGSAQKQQPGQPKKSGPVAQLPQNRDIKDMGNGVFSLGGHVCTVTEVIEDGEDNNNQVTVKDGRNGYIYSFADENGTTISPERGSTFAQTPGGAQGSAYAPCVKGTVALAAIAYAGLGMNLVEPAEKTMDLSKYDGIAFRVRRGSDSTQRLRMKVPDSATNPGGGQCTDKCYNDFGADLVMSEEWQQFMIPFSEMKQMQGWGSPRPPSIDKTKIYSLQFQVLEKQKNFDFCIDDIALIKCST
jgi:endoglucanase